MPQKIEKSFDVPLGNGRIKKVQIIYDLTFYSEKKYKKDFNDFVNYQTRKEKIQSPGDQDLIYYRLKSYPYIPYEQFLNSVSELFSKIILQVLTNNPSIMVSDDGHFKVTLILYRVLGRDWYFDADPNDTLKDKHPEFIKNLEFETVENISYLVAGVYLINSIAAPWFYLKRIPSSFVYRYLMHEFEHHKQYMMDTFRLSEKIKERLKGRVGNYPNYRITFLFLAMYELLEEGIADFATIANRPRMDIRMDAILQFREDLSTLVTIVGKRKAEDFYEKNLSHGILTKGSYYCGKIMCFAIELAIAKKRGKPLLAYVGKEEYPLEDIDRFMGKYRSFEIENPPLEVFKEAYQMIALTRNKYRNFLRLYESACEELGITEKNMVISYATYNDIKKKATKFYEKYAKEEREKMYEKIKGLVG